MKKSIIKFAIVFIMSFYFFNKGMNSIFEHYTITITNIAMVVLSLAAVTIFVLFEVLPQIDDSVKTKKTE